MINRSMQWPNDQSFNAMANDQSFNAMANDQWSMTQFVIRTPVTNWKLPGHGLCTFTVQPEPGGGAQ
jgi:hypothetical protein